MADKSSSNSSIDFSKLKVPDLKRELKLRGLSVSGNKNELIERLQAAHESGKSEDSKSVKSEEDLEEDLLNDEDDEHLDENDSILENDLDDSVISKGDSTGNRGKESNNEPPKKVVLNRNISNSSTESKPIEKSSTQNEEKQEKKVIKLSELSAKERLEMRAKKFGVTDLSMDTKKLVRAERFSVNNSSDSITSSPVNTNLDVLKQRALRFGTSVSSVMSNLENKEKLEKRKLRFGSNNGTSEDEKAKLRLKRFKQAET